MGRRPSGAYPAMRLHKQSGQARIRLNGTEYRLGQHGSPAAQMRYDELIAAWIASGRTSLDAGRAVIGRPATPQPVAQPAATHDATGGLTVGELARAWLRDIEATRPDYRKTSLWHGAIAASRAVRPFATMPPLCGKATSSSPRSQACAALAPDISSS